MSASEVGWVDWAFLAVIGVSVLVGLVRGMVYEVMSLLGWVVAYVLAHALSAVVAPSLPIGAPDSGLNLAAAFVLVFVAVLVLWSLVAWLVKKLVQASPLSSLDRFFGAMFGLARGLLVALVVVTAIDMTPLADSRSWRASHGAASLQIMLVGLKPLLPAEVARHLRA